VVDITRKPTKDWRKIFIISCTSTTAGQNTTHWPNQNIHGVHSEINKQKIPVLDSNICLLELERLNGTEEGVFSAMTGCLCKHYKGHENH